MGESLKQKVGKAWDNFRSYAFSDLLSAEQQCCNFLPQDLHVSQGAADNSVDMDRLNRNMPENGRQGHQVLQVSVCVLGSWGMGEDLKLDGSLETKKTEKRNEIDAPDQDFIVLNLATFTEKSSVWLHVSVMCSYIQWALFPSDNWFHWCWMLQN